MKKRSKTGNHHYRVNIDWSDEDGCFVARVPELPGCASDGETYVEAAANIAEAISAYVETMKDLGKKLPEPLSARKLSGKIALRVAPEVHRDAMAKAMIEDVSLNQFLERAVKRALAG